MVDNEGRVEYLLAGMAFPDKVKLRDNPNVWITDTGATVHLSPHEVGMMNLRDPKGEDNITMGNGNNQKASKIADLVVTVCDKQDFDKGKAKISEVTLAPTTKFNLFSLTYDEARVGIKRKQYDFDQ